MFALYADGSCLGNPGPGGAAWLFVANGAPVAEGSLPVPFETTNNQMELRAAIDGLTAINGQGIAPCLIVLRFDSRYVLDGIFTYMDGWKARAWSKVKNPELWQELDAVLTTMRTQGFAFEHGWVKGHDPQGDVYNHRVDAAAGKASARAKAEMATAAAAGPQEAPSATATPAPVVAPAVTSTVDADAPSAMALMACDMLLMVARDPSVDAKAFYKELVLLRRHLGL